MNKIALVCLVFLIILAAVTHLLIIWAFVLILASTLVTVMFVQMGEKGDTPKITVYDRLLELWEEHPNGYLYVHGETVINYEDCYRLGQAGVNGYTSIIAEYDYRQFVLFYLHRAEPIIFWKRIDETDYWC